MTAIDTQTSLPGSPLSVELKGKQLKVVVNGEEHLLGKSATKDTKVTLAVNDCLKTWAHRAEESIAKQAHTFVEWMVSRYEANIKLLDKVAVTEKLAMNLGDTEETNEKLVKQEHTMLEKWKKKGFDEAIFEQHPDFAEFVLSNDLHHMMSYYNDKPLLQNGQPLIRFKGEMTPWNVVAKEIERDDKGKIVGWFYTYDKGLDQKDPLNWEEPWAINKVKAPNKYLFTVCTGIKKFPHGPFGEGHSWIEMTTPEGLVYCLGMWTPPELEKGGASKALATRPAAFMCPDTYTFMAEERLDITRTSFEITGSDFQKLWNEAKRIKKNGYPFNWLNRNCSVFACDMAAIVGINLNTDQTIFNLLPEKVQNCFNAIWNCVPIWVQCLLKTIVKILMIPIKIILSTILCCVGAGRGMKADVVDCEGNPTEGKKRYALINSFADFVWNDTIIRLPRKLLAVQQEVEKMRKNEREEAQKEYLQTIDEKDDHFAYDYRLNREENQTRREEHELWRKKATALRDLTMKYSHSPLFIPKELQAVHSHSFHELKA